MVRLGTKIYCPKCAAFSVCRAIPPTKAGEPKGQRWYRSDYRDISWFRRARKCLLCETVFLTAEVEEKFLEELISLREKMAVKNKNTASRLRSTKPWLVRHEDIPLELAQEFVRATAWWHTHSSGSPVKAPNHSNRIYKNHHGWVVDFGANSFLVGKAVSRCAKEINNYIDKAVQGEVVQLDGLKQKLMLHIRGAVANHNQDEYDGYYALVGSDMMFGAQSIDVKDGVNFIISRSGINDLITV